MNALRDDLVAGRLTLDEFSERVGIAYAASVGTDLVVARESLPVQTVPTRRRPTLVSVAVFARLIRRGRLRLRRRTVVLSAFADIDFDIRAAQIEARRVTLHVIGLFGNVDVYVPEGIDVDVGGMIVFGRRRDWGVDVAHVSEPLVRVRVHGLFATVDVWRVPRDVHGSYGEVIKQLRARQRQLPA